MEGELLRVTRVTIKALFGLYDHEFPLDEKNRVTILHGPNGVGKTIVLKCISAFFNGQYSVLRRTPFRSFAVELSDGTQVVILRDTASRPKQPNNRNRREDPAVELIAEVRVAGTKQVLSIKESADTARLARMVEQNSPYIIQVDEESWLDRRTNRVYSSEELVEENGDILTGRLARIREAEPESLRTIRKKVRVSLIETDRLVNFAVDEGGYGRPVRPISNAVDNYAKQLQRHIEGALAQYGRKAQQLDQSFPQRLIQQQQTALSEIEDIKRRMESLEDRQQQLSEIGLLDKIPTRPFDPDSLDDIDRAKLGAMTLYLADSESKIAVFEAIAGKLKLLLESAKTKFKNKVVTISKERGLQAVGVNGEPLALSSLSSGEQHEIVLMYELLFKTSPNTLVLIDEPELSLHVSWQRLFLPELLSVAQTVGFDVVLATHSPFIVGDRLDLMVGLDMDRDDMPGLADSSSRLV